MKLLLGIAAMIAINSCSNNTTKIAGSDKDSTEDGKYLQFSKARVEVQSTATSTN